VIDIHSHLLPGIDDGPATTAESVRMARAAVEAGTTTMVCTPHMLPRRPTPPQAVHEGVAALRAELAAAEVPLTILPGGEIALERLRGMDDDELRASSLGGGGRWLLIEMPFTGWPLDLGRIVEDLEIRGFRAVLAHPERAQSLQRQPDRLRDAIGRGALTQINASSLTGGHGVAAERTARALLRLGWAHLIASDAHSAEWRDPDMRPGLAEAAAELGAAPEDLDWMVREGPELVIAGKNARPPRELRATSRR
jgi:protein-tyrosine phosphatase